MMEAAERELLQSAAQRPSAFADAAGDEDGSSGGHGVFAQQDIDAAIARLEAITADTNNKPEAAEDVY